MPVPLGADDYIELLPATWRVINAYGIKVNHRTYDGKALNPYRRQPSGISAHKDQWEVHYDPYDVTRIWVRNHHDGGWITAPWTHLKTSPVPFGEQAWAQAQQIVARRGNDPATETEIADAVARLLDRAEHGPDTTATHSAANKRDRRVAARTRATSSRAFPRPVDPDSTDEIADTTCPTRDVTNNACAGKATGDGLAPVIPLAVFDARDEAKRWW